MTRFVAMRWPPADGARERRAGKIADALRIQNAHWRQVLNWRGIMILVLAERHDARLIEFAEGAGCIIGGFFRRVDGQSRALSAIDKTESQFLAAQGASALFAEYWGDYVALLVDRAADTLRVVRDPLAGKPCYFDERDGLVTCFSDPADLAEIVEFRVNLKRVGLFLGYPYVSSVQSALEGVSELLPGHELKLHRTTKSLACNWLPPHARLEAGPDRADNLAATVEACTIARAQSARQIVHRLSGGLDSSIVLGLLCQTRPAETILAVNVSSAATPEGDERRYARLVCKHHDVKLLEIELDPREVDYAALLSAPLSASPTRADFSFAEIAHDAALTELALGPDVLMTSGQGGDHLFHRSRTSLIAADAFRMGLPVKDVLGISMEVARMGGVSVWRVLADVFRHGVGHAPLDLSAQFPGKIGGHDNWAAAAIDEHMRHPWMDGWLRRPANEVRRSLSLIHALHYHTPNALSLRVQATPVLLSQPIVEWAMAQPAHVLTAGGVERGYYRRCFAHLLPSEVLQRVTKAETTRHFAAIIQRNRSFLNDLLPRGRLVEGGLVTSAYVRALLGRLETINVAALSEALHLVAAEIWLLRWANAMSRRNNVD